MDKLRTYIDHLDNLAITLLIFSISILLGLLLKSILFKLLDIYNRNSNPRLVSSLTKHLKHPLTLFMPLLFVAMALPTVPLSDKSIHTLRRILEIINILVFAWTLI